MSKSKSTNPLNEVQSGVLDPSIEGPDIGTLVLVVDRAKNLPNRKTIGKQDPYCAARLGKEAKKTSTDIRGGQTPKWDQELRFGVYDSPDYYQLKVSCFSDDKKTELIGETWIDLRDIVVSGGGQSDEWHTLNCRGKYAGEIRIEITYYDTRPKPERPPAPASTAASVAGSVSGSTKGRAADVNGARPLPTPGVPKRRPLPSDPVTGQAPALPAPPVVPVVSAPPPIPENSASLGLPLPYSQDHMQTPPRTLPGQPPAAYNTPGQSPLPPLGYNGTPPQQQQQQQYYQQEDPDSYAPIPVNEDDFDLGYDTAPPPPMAHHHLQYPQQHYSQQQQEYRDGYSGAPFPAAPFDDPSGMAPEDDRPPPPPAHRNRNNSAGANEALLRNGYDASPSKGTLPLSMRQDVLRSEAHRHSISSAYPGRPTYKPLEPGQQAVASPPASVAGSSGYGGPAPEPQLQSSPPRHMPYDSGYDAQQRAMEDPNGAVAPLGPASFRKSGSRMPLPLPPPSSQQQPQPQPQQGYEYNEYNGYNEYAEYNEPEFDKVPSPAPLNLSGRRRNSGGPVDGYAPATPTRRPVPQQQPGPSYDSPEEPHQAYNDPDSSGLVDGSSPYYPPPVPSSLVPGVDPGLALELRSRIHQEERGGSAPQQTPPQNMPPRLPMQQQQQQQQQQRRYTLPPQSMSTPPRGRHMLEGPPNPGQNSSPQNYTPPSHRQQGGYDIPAYDTPPQQQAQSQMARQERYDQGAVPYSPGASSPAGAGQPRGSSPNPRHTIKRKSVSPAPPPTESPEPKLSSVPFGPDSYDMLNPTVAASADSHPPDYDETKGKIITHDGREVDPSDHLPMNTWAPEPESKPGSNSSTPTSSTGPKGRRPLRIAGRGQPNLASTGITFSSSDDSAVQYTPTSRNRLQKRANRQSTTVLPVNTGSSNIGMPVSPQGSSPLAPLSHPRQQDNFPPARVLTRASTFDVANENHMPSSFATSPGRMSFSAAPPIPAKLPIANGSPHGGPYGNPRGGPNGAPNGAAGRLGQRPNNARGGSYSGPSTGYGGGGGSGGYNGGVGGGSVGGGNVSNTPGGRSPIMSGALPAPAGGARALPWDTASPTAGMTGSPSEMALMEEMSRIDIGSGRARRHQARYH